MNDTTKQVDGEAISDAAVEAACTAAYGKVWTSKDTREYMRRAIAAALPHLFAPKSVSNGAGMLPDQLVPFADEWYRLCERSVAASKIMISGELAEAIVAAMRSVAPLPPQGANVEYQWRCRTAGGNWSVWAPLSTEGFNDPSFGGGTRCIEKRATPQPAALNEPSGNSGRLAGVVDGMAELDAAIEHAALTPEDREDLPTFATVVLAKKLARLMRSAALPLPLEMPAMEVGVTPSGSITFDWFTASQCQLSFLAGDGGRIGFACFIDGQRSHGGYPGDADELPSEMVSAAESYLARSAYLAAQPAPSAGERA